MIKISTQLLTFLLAIFSFSLISAAPNGKPFQEVQEQVEGVQQTLQQDVEVTVDCFNGEMISDVLNTYKGNPGHLTINVQGMCAENIVINRDDVTLRGAIATLGSNVIRSLDDSLYALNASGFNRIFVDSLRFEGSGGEGLRCQYNGTVRLSNVHVSGFRTGIDVEQEGFCEVIDSIITDNTIGLRVNTKGYLRIVRTEVLNNNTGVLAERGGVATIPSGSIISGSTFGIRVRRFATIDLNRSTLDQNRTGIRIEGLATVVSRAEITISNSEVLGIQCTRQPEYSVLFVEAPIAFLNNTIGDISPECPPIPF